MEHPDIAVGMKYGGLLHSLNLSAGRVIVCCMCLEAAGVRYLLHNGEIICRDCYEDYTREYFSAFWMEG
jgi:hypothetical protein